MHTLCRLCVWRMCEAKNFVAILIDPVLVIFDAVFPLRFPRPWRELSRRLLELFRPEDCECPCITA